ncbi:MAG: Holliday junction resolvase RuvX [Clostridia bacterium]|nr:Holliday junction resolvase RuvX [Clostridia bacterium]MBR2893224.1 Holliday junction resolvase RuvX [Clostridia bacterium]
MVILSVDYGDKRTGIAVCDRLEMLASPVTVIWGDYAPKVMAEIEKLTAEYKVQQIVVGLPKNMDGSEGERAEKCRAFAKELGEKTGIETVMVDERLTTVSAHKALNVTNVRGQKRKDVVDAVSAVMILESYLNKRKASR